MELNLQSFQKAYREHHLLDPSKKVLIGLSGGVDSMVLAHLCLKSGFKVELAHCNFNLRGAESDADEQFIRNFAKGFRVQVFTGSFDTREKAESMGTSIQNAARVVRYEWFEALAKKRKISQFALGHHADDNFESGLFYLITGGGWRQQMGIPRTNGIYVRPLLSFSKASILEYARKNNLDWREDLSNEQSDYLRNKIRHELVPQIRKINPHPEQSYGRLYRRNQQIRETLDGLIAQTEWPLEKTEAGLSLDLKKLRSLPAWLFFLEDLLYPYGYSGVQLEELEKFLHSKTGSRFLLPGAELLMDRGKLILSKNGMIESTDFWIKEKLGERKETKGRWIWSVEDPGSGYSQLEPSIGIMNLDSLDFPLLVRLWQPGDLFQPLGMKGKKKVSDFLIDEKIPLNLKKRTRVLVSGTEVVWVEGLRISEKVKVKPDTKKCFRIQFKRTHEESF